MKQDELNAIAARLRELIEQRTTEMILGRDEPALQRVHAAYDRVLAEAGVAETGDAGTGVGEAGA